MGNTNSSRFEEGEGQAEEVSHVIDQEICYYHLNFAPWASFEIFHMVFICELILKDVCF